MEVENFDALRVGLATSDDIRSWSNGEVKKPETINYRTLKPEKDGLFCEKIFGPTKDWECSCGKYKRVRFKGIVCERCGVEVTKSSVRRERMGHIELAAPVTHIWYFKGVPSRLGYLLNMAPKDLEKIIYFAAYRVMAIHHEDITLDRGLIKEDYVHRISTLMENRMDEILAVAAAEVEALQGLGLALEPSIKLWEAPIWVDAQFAKTVEQLIDAEEKNPEGFWGKKAVAAAEEAADEEQSPVVRSAAEEKQIKQLLSEFKKKTDKIIKEYARIERPANLQKEQLAWRLFLTTKSGDLIQNDVIFDHFDYSFGEYFDTSIGAEAVQRVLAEFDLDAAAAELRELIATTKGTKQTQAIKRLKVVQSFIGSSTPPTSMVLDVLPVLPPEIRPMVQLDGGRFATSDLNDLYRRVINRNNRLKRFIDLGAVPKTILNNEKRMLQEAVDALFDNGRRGRAVTGTGNRALKSLSDLLKGKQGRFRQNLLGKRVDYSGRSVIVVGPQLKLHQCGLPKLMALELFKPFVMKRLVDLGLAQNIKSAKRMVERSRPQVWGVLEEVIRERPVLLNRAPTLHRLGIQAFEPQLVEGKAIQLHPLVCAAFNADFDGDQMAVHLPLSVEAQAEARILMLASNNILKPSDGRPVAVPTQDMIIGLFHLTNVKEGAVGEGNLYGSIAEAQMAFDAKALDLQAKARIRFEKNGETKLRETSLGLALFNQTLPDEYDYVDYQVGKKEIGKIVAELVEKFSRVEVAQSLDRIKDAGFYWATRSGVSMSIADANFDASGAFDKARSKMIIDGEKEHTKIQEAFDNGLKSDLERRDELGALWFKRTNEIQNLLQESIPADNAIYKMVTSGARGNWLQIRSIIGMRGPVATSSGDFAPMPVKGNYLVGLTANEYFINATGARKGNADTAMKTAAAGYLTRRLVDVAQDVIVREHDCETTKGLEKSLKDIDGNWDEQTIELSVLHRALQNDVVVGKDVIAKAGQTVDQKLVDAFKAADVEAVSVRSVLTCESLQGVCALCYGISLATGDAVELGEAIGIIAAQSIGEPGTQLTMRTFHTGGAASSAKKQTILKSIGGQKVRVERLISYDITQGLNGVTDLLEARVGWRQQGKVAVMAFWPGTVDIVEVPTSGGAKKFDIYVRPNGEAAEKEAEEMANRYSFSRTTSKTFKKLSPYTPITSVSNPDDLLVEKGEVVKAGDYLVDGTPIPHEVLMVKGAREAAAEIIRGVQAIYGSQGVPLHDKHLEVIVRQMLGKVTVIDSGETDMLPGEIIDFNRFKATNRVAVSEGKKPASARQEVMGMTRASLAAQSWLSAASFQETTRVLTQAALDRREDPLVGLKENVIIGKLIPAGTGLKVYRNITVEATEEAKAEKYPNRSWTESSEAIDFTDDFSATDLSFTSIESYSDDK
jgi:DNA-directed RNA polymerase subunit beta'